MQESAEEDVVLSDLHMENVEQSESPVRVTRYTIRLPSTSTRDLCAGGAISSSRHRNSTDLVGSDEEQDGENDAIVRRRKRKLPNGNVLHVTLQHRMATPLSMVGLQLWKGALLLCDYLLTHPPLEPQTVLMELGAGVGLAAIVAGLVWDTVFLTDYSDAVLHTAAHNVSVNGHLLRQLGKATDLAHRVKPRRYDWKCAHETDPLIAARNQSNMASNADTAFDWTSEDVQALSNHPVTFVAADVIYDDEITNAFFHKLARIMRPGEALIMALERRVNFSIETMAAVAHGYHRFMGWIHCAPDNVADAPSSFQGERLDIDFAQCVESYERTEELELWKITKL